MQNRPKSGSWPWPETLKDVNRVVVVEENKYCGMMKFQSVYLAYPRRFLIPYNPNDFPQAPEIPFTAIRDEDPDGFDGIEYEKSDPEFYEVD